MDKGKWWVVSIFLILALVKVHSFGSATDNIWTSSLQGLKEVYVEVEPLDPAIEKAGLTRKQLQTDVELELKKAGIKTLLKEQCQSTKGCGLLTVGVATRKSGSGRYDYYVLALYFQKVSLERDPEIKTIAATWMSEGILGTGYDTNAFASIRTSVKQQVDEFLVAVLSTYLSVNPK